MFNNFFRRETSNYAQQEQLRLANLTLQGRVERLLEDQTTKRLRYNPVSVSTSRYYSQSF
jgi:hypothetical protein